MSGIKFVNIITPPYYEQYVKLKKRVWPSFSETELKPNGPKFGAQNTIFAFDGDRLVGYAYIHYDFKNSIAYVSDYSIDREYELRNSFGKKLLIRKLMSEANRIAARINVKYIAFREPNELPEEILKTKDAQGDGEKRISPDIAERIKETGAKEMAVEGKIFMDFPSKPKGSVRVNVIATPIKRQPRVQKQVETTGVQKVVGRIARSWTLPERKP